MDVIGEAHLLQCDADLAAVGRIPCKQFNRHLYHPSGMFDANSDHSLTDGTREGVAAASPNYWPKLELLGHVIPRAGLVLVVQRKDCAMWLGEPDAGLQLKTSTIQGNRPP